MTKNSYRPEIGETLFISFMNEKPYLVTVTGYHNDDRFSSEQIDFTTKDGRPKSMSLSNVTFHPDAPIDTAFIYVVVLEQNEFMERSDTSELGFFFDPQSAFDFKEAVEAGEVKARYEATAEFVEYSVRVEKAD